MVEMASIAQHLGALPSVESLYGEPIFALGLLKLMNDDITRLVFSLLTSSIHISQLRHIPNIKESLSTLIQIRLIDNNESVVSLNRSFRASLLRGFCLPTTDVCYEMVCDILGSQGARSGGSLPHSTAPDVTGGRDTPAAAAGDDSLRKVIRDVSSYKFQNLLQAVVNKSAELFFAIKDILLFCNLSDSFNQITSQGFEFLLKNKSDQHWFIIVNSIKYFSKSPEEEMRMLACLMEIVVKRKIAVYRTRQWSRWLRFLDSIGVLHILASREVREGDLTLVACIGRLAAGSCAAAQVGGAISRIRELSPGAGEFTYFYINNHDLFTIGDAAESQSSKFIILETNYKIYAYTSKSYEKSILNLFSKTVYALPNLVKARLDEESMCRAFSKGIMARQILKYLNEFSDGVPPSVANQIIIWENKQYRIKDNNAIMYSDFLHLSDYLGVLRFLEERHAVLLKDEAKRIIVGTESTYEATKEFIQTL